MIFLNSSVLNRMQPFLYGMINNTFTMKFDLAQDER